jgi:hypothetical protein
MMRGAANLLFLLRWNRFLACALGGWKASEAADCGNAPPIGARTNE